MRCSIQTHGLSTCYIQDDAASYATVSRVAEIRKGNWNVEILRELVIFDTEVDNNLWVKCFPTLLFKIVTSHKREPISSSLEIGGKQICATTCLCCLVCYKRELAVFTVMQHNF